MENDRKLTQLIAGLNEGQRDLRDAVMRLSVIAEAHQDTLTQKVCAIRAPNVLQ